MTDTPPEVEEDDDVDMVDDTNDTDPAADDTADPEFDHADGEGE